MQNFREDILLRLNQARLDADLAAGRSPETSRSHAARARRLVAPRMRYALAANWEHLVQSSHRPVCGRSGRVPVRRERVHDAEPEIRQLVAALRANGPMPARGVAMAVTLLADGLGPIYNPNAPDDLTAKLELAVEQLNPALPLTE